MRRTGDPGIGSSGGSGRETTTNLANKEKGLEQSLFPLLSQRWADLSLLTWKLELSRDKMAPSRGAISKLLRTPCSA